MFSTSIHLILSLGIKLPKLFTDKLDLTPTNYNSKFMDSIWGQYNRYSVHNLKKILNNNRFEDLAMPLE